jgi:hypothetical protein
MNATSIYIQKLVVENIKTFTRSTTLDFTRPEGGISQWTLLLGDNGIGKSTLLQFVAWMRPALPYDVNDPSKYLIPAPLINDEENEVLERLVHRANKGGQVAKAKAIFIANQRLNEAASEPLVECTTKMVIGVNDAGKLVDVSPDFSTKEKSIFYRDEVAVYAYSASRQLGRLNLNNPKLVDTIPGFILEKTELYDAEEILHALNYAELGAKGAKKIKYHNFIERIKSMLASLLPDCEQIDDIIITPPNPLDGREGGIAISTKHGQEIPFNDFSLGYKTVASWTIDLAWRLFSKHHAEVENPLEEPGIVLIDEIDLHLHPLWQRNIMANLSKHFPNIQFIASAHSPIMAQAAIGLNYAVLKFSDDGVQILNEPEGITGWRVDQILTSELFGLTSARGEDYDKLLERQEKLLRKKKLTQQEKQELDNLTQDLKRLPTAEKVEVSDDRQLIDDFIQELKDSKFKIKL